MYEELLTQIDLLVKLTHRVKHIFTQNTTGIYSEHQVYELCYSSIKLGNMLEKLNLSIAEVEVENLKATEALKGAKKKVIKEKLNVDELLAKIDDTQITSACNENDILLLEDRAEVMGTPRKLLKRTNIARTNGIFADTVGNDASLGLNTNLKRIFPIYIALTWVFVIIFVYCAPIAAVFNVMNTVMTALYSKLPIIAKLTGTNPTKVGMCVGLSTLIVIFLTIFKQILRVELILILNLRPEILKNKAVLPFIKPLINSVVFYSYKKENLVYADDFVCHIRPKKQFIESTLGRMYIDSIPMSKTSRINSKIEMLKFDNLEGLKVIAQIEVMIENSNLSENKTFDIEKVEELVDSRLE